MSIKKSSPSAIRTACFRTTMPVAKFRALIEAAVAQDPVLNGSFVVGPDPSLFRVMGMDQHGDILLSHCNFKGVNLGVRVSLRYRLGDQAVLDRLVAALGTDVEPVPCGVKGAVLPHEDRSVGHLLLELSSRKLPGGCEILPSAIESGLDCLWDDEPEIKRELALLASIPRLLSQGGPEAAENQHRVNQLLQTYEPVMSVRHRGRTLPLNRQMHLPSEDGQTVLRIHFARDPLTRGFVVGWVDEYDAA